MVSTAVDSPPPTEALQQALLGVDRIQARAIVKDYSQDRSPFELVEELFVPVMEEIGQGWEAGEIALSQVYMSGQICAELADGLAWEASEKPWPQPPMAICVLEDYHLLGKQMVYSALKASGYDLIDYGRMDIDALLERVKKDGIQLLLVSALMLRAALRVKVLRARLQAEGLQVRLVVGGAPFRFDAKLWQEVGADAMARNTAEALTVVRELS
ncbi:MAG: cobalamin-dependent protein [Magnetococcales bacterium]|nr:cobalamin-dependent protein [Magnetococcales bacterium]